MDMSPEEMEQKEQTVIFSRLEHFKHFNFS